MLFEKSGAHNTDETLKIAFNEAGKRGIGHVVIASTWGDTAQKAMEYRDKYPEINIVIVTHNCGFKKPGIVEFNPDLRKVLTEKGIHVITGTMPTRTLGRAINEKLGFSQEDIACAAWRMFGQGTKVCVEIAAMACDSGLIPPGDIISVSGTGKGADTAIVITADSSNRTFDMKIREYLAKPIDF